MARTAVAFRVVVACDSIWVLFRFRRPHPDDKAMTEARHVRPEGANRTTTDRPVRRRVAAVDLDEHGPGTVLGVSWAAPSSSARPDRPTWRAPGPQTAPRSPQPSVRRVGPAVRKG